MNKSYAICIPQKDKEDYILTMPLEEIDNAFVTLGRAGVLARIKEYDSVVKETNCYNVFIKVMTKNNKFYSDRYIDIITDEYLLNFPVEPILLDENDGIKNAHILYNRLLPYLKRNITKEFQVAINELQDGKDNFINLFNSLNYDEKRIIRGIILQNIDIFKYLNKELETLTLKKEMTN